METSLFKIEKTIPLHLYKLDGFVKKSILAADVKLE